LKYKDKTLKITCDGGGATGKSTGSKLIAKKYKLAFLSSGLLYRYASFLIITKKPKNKIAYLKKKFRSLNYKKITRLKLHTPEISTQSAQIAKELSIRNILKQYQKKFIRNNKRCVLEGRDASTKILPKSDLKFFFTCNLNVAAKRRYNELKSKGLKVKFSSVKNALKLRNILDKKRKHSPLKKHKNAIVVDTGKLNKQKMLSKMSSIVEKFLEKKYGK